MWSTSHAKNVVSAIVFAGTVVGQLFFGVLADRWSRTNSLLISTVILFVFTALAAGSYFHGSAIGMFNILAAWRFFVGIGIGGEYPAGSVGCAESTGEVRSGWRHFVFILYVSSTRCVIFLFLCFFLFFCYYFLFFILFFLFFIFFFKKRVSFRIR